MISNIIRSIFSLLIFSLARAKVQFILFNILSFFHYYPPNFKISISLGDLNKSILLYYTVTNSGSWKRLVTSKLMIHICISFYSYFLKTFLLIFTNRATKVWNQLSETPCTLAYTLVSMESSLCSQKRAYVDAEEALALLGRVSPRT